MVNLRGGLAGLGRGLAAAGEYGVRQQMQEEQDRRLFDRQVALANLEARLRSDAADVQSKRELVQSEARDQQLLDREEKELAIREPYREREHRRTVSARREERREEREHQAREWDRRTERSFQDWRRRQGIEEDNYRSRQQWMRENGMLRGDNPRLIRDGETGTWVEYFPDGTMVDTGRRFPQSGGDDFLNLDDDEEPERPTGGRQGTLRGARGGQPDRARPSANTYTDEDVRATMQANNMTREQAIRAIEARGYRRAQ